MLPLESSNFTAVSAFGQLRYRNIVWMLQKKTTIEIQDVLMLWEDFFDELMKGSESRASHQGNHPYQFGNNEFVPPPTSAEMHKCQKPMASLPIF